MADHPVKVPPELVKQWWKEIVHAGSEHWPTDVATRAAQWGADQELEACCEYLQSEIGPLEAAHFRAAMRPKPPTLAEQGMEALNKGCFPSNDEIATIRAALNRLAELEAQQ
jgi:hypothetical protein